MNKAKETIEKACAEFNKTRKNDKIEAVFEHNGKNIGIPKSILDLVMALNPKDDKQRADINKELFKDNGEKDEKRSNKSS